VAPFNVSEHITQRKSTQSRAACIACRPFGLQGRLWVGEPSLTGCRKATFSLVKGKHLHKAAQRIDALFDIQRDILGLRADQRLAARQRLNAPLTAELQAWMQQHRVKRSTGHDVAKARHSLGAYIETSGQILHLQTDRLASERDLRRALAGRLEFDVSAAHPALDQNVI
jgi:Transposase IS66 family